MTGQRFTTVSYLERVKNLDPSSESINKLTRTFPGQDSMDVVSFRKLEMSRPTQTCRLGHKQCKGLQTLKEELEARGSGSKGALPPSDIASCDICSKPSILLLLVVGRR